MLTLEALLKTIRHNRSYGRDGRHQFGNEPRPPESEDSQHKLDQSDTAYQSQED